MRKYTDKLPIVVILLKMGKFFGIALSSECLPKMRNLSAKHPIFGIFPKMRNFPIQHRIVLIFFHFRPLFSRFLPKMRNFPAKHTTFGIFAENEKI